MSEFLQSLRNKINTRRKMTSPLYQTVLSGNASKRLLQQFVINRFPIKNHWTRNILGIASRIPDHPIRTELVENVFEEETGYFSKSKRHLETFVDFGKCVGVSQQQINAAPLLPETKAVIEHNIEACNTEIHFTAGVASVLLLMEGQPPVVTNENKSMLSVMKDVYKLPEEGYEFFVHHASNVELNNGSFAAVSELEEDHAATAEKILEIYCNTDELKIQALKYLDRAIDRRHAHFDAIYNLFYDASEPPFRFDEEE
ncbi:pyrroloquinoline quinone biosynthesis protein PqqC [Advenella sp. S44]|uniref:TenA family transcriptional regulator n=1 Tax=Advenella sp. S44 TaxID=1982755 RepID=UPI000C2AC609|nr:iron-containing redox enzyme family protein [Advenella sp. S44]PJX27975.1 pyrroloquinoline quinone biosynthesis protein PqqC [Advenella sp. S44]